MKSKFTQAWFAGGWLRPTLGRLSAVGLFSLLIAGLGVSGLAVAGQPQPTGASNEWQAHDGRDHDGDHDHRQRQQALVLGNVVASAWDDGRTVGVQFDVANNIREAVKDVRVTSITLEGGDYQGPVKLPILLGPVQGLQHLLVDAIFRLAPINGTPHPFTLAGTYVKHGKTVKFRLNGTISPNTAEPGPFKARTGLSTKQSLRNAFFPPPIPRTPDNNAETPPLIPIGPQRQVFPATPTATGVSASMSGAAVEIVRNNTSGTSSGVPPDPNAAASAPDGVVLTTFNTGISFSTDGGATFTNINLFAPQPGNPARRTFFPESDGGLCCDQIVLYLPARNLFVWLLQYKAVFNAAGTTVTASNRLRIAWASPQDIATDFYNAWTYVDLTGPSVTGVSSGMGLTSSEWMDYPDLAFSDTFLYVGVDHAYAPDSVFPDRRIVARLSLADIADASIPTVGYNRTELTGASGLSKSHFIQGAPARMVLGALDNSSRLRVFTFADNAGAAVSSSVTISSIMRGNSYTSVAPDGNDWLKASFPGNITGGAFRRLPAENPEGFRDEYLFAFDAGVNAGGGRPQAYVRLETLVPPTSSATTYNAFAEYDIWNNDFAYAMAVPRSDGREIGINLAVGGGTIGYPQNAVGFRDDFVVYQVTSSNATQVGVIRGVQVVRFGDYLGNRLIPGERRFFGAEVYDVILNPLPPGVPSGTCATVGCTATVRYVIYGRPVPVIP
ncbi:hypothetical protein [Massilia horti]|uniref:Uncharacterized protein n=1 Tax=Massilia horti TaxID=2562153 RepID=A0A4Y9T917_9BURK|nr:hypothetical protein [Massilia horti]TFW35543.1 hypothetical protein E4O92_01755 [Massilia horti]